MTPVASILKCEKLTKLNDFSGFYTEASTLRVSANAYITHPLPLLLGFLTHEDIAKFC